MSINTRIKQLVQKIPLIGALAARLYQFVNNSRFVDSERYWENRYQAGGTSGEGSYGRLAIFKADILNAFIETQEISSVIEFGCGDGAQLALARYPKYIGLDVSPKAVQTCIVKFGKDTTKSFFIYKTNCFKDNHGLFLSDLSISLDVIYHLVEDDLYFAYLTDLFECSRQFVVLYTTDTDTREAYQLAHVKRRHVSQDIQRQFPHWQLISRVPNKYPTSLGEKETSDACFLIYKKNPEHS